jgi:ribosomal protein S18 acetylase RimI-like enzyme
MNYRIVQAEVSQANVLAELINQHELAIDPESTSIGLEESKEIIEGFYDPAIAAFIYTEGIEEPSGFYSVNPDATRKRLFTDVYARPGSNLIKEALIESLKAAAEKYPEYENWYGVNTKDAVMRSALESLGMQVIRTYWHMKKELTTSSAIDNSRPEIFIRLVSGDQDMQTWWKLHQDAFSKHFGFAPRPMQLWVEQTLAASTLDPEACFILEYEGEPAGFVQLANANYHLNGGYVDVLGVAHKFQGLGLGQTLLQHAINHSVAAGRSFIELNVDSGNESGALRLYEKLDFKPNSAWEQYENKNWVEFVRGL